MLNYHKISKYDRVKATLCFKFSFIRDISVSLIKVILLISLSLVLIKLYFPLLSYFLLFISLFIVLLIFLYHSFFIIYLPSFLISKIFYNNSNANINFNQSIEVKSYIKNSIKSTVVFISKTFQDDKKVSNEEQYKIIVPLIHHNVIFQSIRQNLSFYLVFLVSIFFIITSIVFIYYSFWTIDEIKEVSCNSSNDNYIFVYSLLLFLLYVFFTTFLIRNRKDYFKLRSMKNTGLYKKYFLIDYVIDGIYLEPRKTLFTKEEGMNGSERNEEPTIFKNFITAYIAILFSVYVPLTYNKIYVVDVAVKSIDNKIIKGLK